MIAANRFKPALYRYDRHSTLQAGFEDTASGELYYEGDEVNFTDKNNNSFEGIVKYGTIPELAGISFYVEVKGLKHFLLGELHYLKHLGD